MVIALTPSVAHPLVFKRKRATLAPSLNTSSLSHKKRASADLNDREVAHLMQAVKATEKRGKPLNAAILARLDLSPTYKGIWAGSETGNLSAAETKLRNKARTETARKFSTVLNNLARSLGRAITSITVFECPQAGGTGLHAHILLHLECHKEAEIILKALSRFFSREEDLLLKFRKEKEFLQNLVDTHKLPFDLRGEQSFIKNPESPFFTKERLWNTAAYFLKSADQKIRILSQGKVTTLQEVRLVRDKPLPKNIKSYEPQVNDMGIKKRLRFSRDLGGKRLSEEGFTYDNAEDAGWLLQSERNPK